MKDRCVKSFNRVEANLRSQTICFSHSGWSPSTSLRLSKSHSRTPKILIRGGSRRGASLKDQVGLVTQPI